MYDPNKWSEKSMSGFSVLEQKVMKARDALGGLDSAWLT